MTYVFQEPPVISLKGAAMTPPIPTASGSAAAVVSLTLSLPGPAAGLTAITAARLGRIVRPPNPPAARDRIHGDVGRGDEWRSGEREDREHQSCTRSTGAQTRTT